MMIIQPRRTIMIVFSPHTPLLSAVLWILFYFLSASCVDIVLLRSFGNAQIDIL
jgi:hypothetical protein